MAIEIFNRRTNEKYEPNAYLSEGLRMVVDADGLQMISLMFKTHEGLVFCKRLGPWIDQAVQAEITRRVGEKATCGVLDVDEWSDAELCGAASYVAITPVLALQSNKPDVVDFCVRVSRWLTVEISSRLLSRKCVGV